MAILKDTEVSGIISTDYLEVTGNSLAQPVVPVGCIIALHPDAPTPDSTYFHFCDGTAYPDSIIIDGSTNSPDLVNYFLKGALTSGQVSKTTHNLITDDLPSHNHPGSTLSLSGGSTTTPSSGSHGHTIQVYIPGGGEFGFGFKPLGGDSNDGRIWYSGTSGSSHSHTVPAHYHNYSVNPTISNYGDNTAFSIMPQYYVVKFYQRYR